jgi:hypothetical protein
MSINYQTEERKLLAAAQAADGVVKWLDATRGLHRSFDEGSNWISAHTAAVNEAVRCHARLGNFQRRQQNQGGLSQERTDLKIGNKEGLR